MLSLFYAAAIALNTQLVFVHDRPPKDNKKVYFLIVPLIVAFTICSYTHFTLVQTVLTSSIGTPALIAGVYGYDEIFEYCWYETRGLDDQTIILRMVFTYNLWLCLTLLYLVVAGTLITWSIFNPRHPLAARPTQVEHHRRSPSSHSMTDVNATLTATLARRDTARRALTVRLLGYILVPTVSVISGMVLDLLGESKSGANIPSAVTITVAALAGLMGTLNGILFSFDPSVLAVLHALRLRRAQSRRQQQATPGLEGAGVWTRLEKRTADMANTGAHKSNGVLVITTVDHDAHLEAGSGRSSGMEGHDRYYPRPSTGTEAVDEGYRRSVSTIGIHVDEVLETYRGL